MSATATDGSATDQAREKAQAAGAQAKDKAQQAQAQARNRVQRPGGPAFDAGRRAGRQRGRRAAQGFRAAPQEGNEPVAKGMEQVAQRVESAGGWLRDADGDTILRDVEDFGRRNPLAVVAGGIALGFAASRLLKASSRNRYETSGGDLRRRRRRRRSPRRAPAVGQVPADPGRAARGAHGRGHHRRDPGHPAGEPGRAGSAARARARTASDPWPPRTPKRICASGRSAISSSSSRARPPRSSARRSTWPRPSSREGPDRGQGRRADRRRRRHRPARRRRADRLPDPRARRGDPRLARGARRRARVRRDRRRARAPGPQPHPGRRTAGARADSRHSEGGRRMGEDPNVIRADIERTREEMGDTVDALGYKADVKSRAKDKMTSTKDRITGRVSDATPDSGRSRPRVARPPGVAQENPLGLAIGAVAVGFVAGMLVPSSRVEDEKIGPLADQVKDQVKETGQEALDRGKDVAQQAAASAKETANEAGREHADELQGLRPGSGADRLLRASAPTSVSGAPATRRRARSLCYPAGSRSGPRGIGAQRLSSGGLVAVAVPAARATPSGSSAERDHEGTTVGQADVREVQDHPPPRSGPRDLPEPATQAATGVGT